MVIQPPLHFRLDTYDPTATLRAAIERHVKDAKWLPAYDEVAAWLSDNQSRGLLCVGPCGLGKSVICAQCLPLIFERAFDGFGVMVVTATEMNQRIDELLAFCGYRHIIVIDDLGTEAPETVTYGNRRRPFCELADTAERTGTLLIITTNLRTTRDTDPRRNYPSIQDRYGDPTIDRLRAITKVIVFRGESLRHAERRQPSSAPGNHL